MNYRKRGSYPGWGFPGRGNSISKGLKARVWLDEMGVRGEVLGEWGTWPPETLRAIINGEDRQEL